MGERVSDMAMEIGAGVEDEKGYRGADPLGFRWRPAYVKPMVGPCGRKINDRSGSSALGSDGTSFLAAGLL